VLDVALFEDERGVLLHLLAALSSLVVTVLINLDLLCGQQIFSFKLNMKLDGLTSLPRNHVIQLTGKVLTWEREVLCEDDRTQDVLTEGLLEALLVGVG